MNPSWERTPTAPNMDGALYIDAVLRPHRSLSAPVVKIVLAVFIVFNAILAAAFWARGARREARGAFAVAGFLGLDVLVLYWAFGLNYRSARAEERVRIAPGKVHVASISASGKAKQWVISPIWVRVAQGGCGRAHPGR